MSSMRPPIERRRRWEVGGWVGGASEAWGQRRDHDGAARGSPGDDEGVTVG